MYTLKENGTKILHWTQYVLQQPLSNPMYVPKQHSLRLRDCKLKLRVHAKAESPATSTSTSAGRRGKMARWGERGQKHPGPQETKVFILGFD